MPFSVGLSLLALLCPLSLQAAELTLSPSNVSPGVYVVVGDLGPQTYDNDGLNANLGFVVTDDGVIVSDTGPSVRVARALHDAIRKVTQKPIALVVNTNGQSQRWVGNSIFRALNVPILAHEAATRLMEDQAGDQLQILSTQLREKAFGTVAVFSTETMNATRIMKFGTTEIHILHWTRTHRRRHCGLAAS